MEPLIFKAATRFAPQAPRSTAHVRCRVTARTPPSINQTRCFTPSARSHIREKPDTSTVSKRTDSDSVPAAELSQDVTAAERNHFDRIEEQSKEKQMRSPWMRAGSEKPPVARPRSAGAMTKGKLLTTPSRMLKLILPLTTRDANADRKDVEPLALLVHPQQPLSYLERLIQSELPVLKTKEGKEKIPTITFRAQDATEEDVGSGKPAVDEIEDADEEMVDGKRQRTGKIKSESKPDVAASPKEDSTDTLEPNEGPMPTKKEQERQESNLDGEHSACANFVRWSPSTEIGDFIRDAARGKEFGVDIEGTPETIYVGVPSFEDRTFYLRMRLRKVSRQILELADIKRECDTLAQKGAQRVAQGGFAGMVAWWGLVYYLTVRFCLLARHRSHVLTSVAVQNGPWLGRHGARYVPRRSHWSDGRLHVVPLSQS